MPRRRYDYKFALDDYSNSFKIKADFLKYFDVKSFQQLETGRMLIVGISNEDKQKLNTTKNYLFVYLITTDTQYFLNHKDTIAFQNSKRDYYYAFGLFCIGLVLIYVGYNLQPKKTTF